MRRLLLCLLLLGAPYAAEATTTWSCVRIADMGALSAGGYLTFGTCTAGGSHTYTTGGDGLGASTATMADAGAAFCGSAAKVVKAVITGCGINATPTGACPVVQITPTTNTVRVVMIGGAATTAIVPELASATDVVATYTFTFLALCQ